MKTAGFLLLVALLIAGCSTASYDRDLPNAVPAARDVRAFVRQTFIHGVPYEEASRFGPGAVPILLEMLEDPRQEPYWANVAITVCMIGEASCVEPVIRFINRAPIGSLSAAHYNAKSCAVMALGYVVNKDGNQRALDYLEHSCQPSSWSARGVRWTAPRQQALERDQDLSVKAILGLGLAGTRAARDALARLHTSRDRTGFLASSDALIEQAIEYNEEIAELGLGEYYRRGH